MFKRLRTYLWKKRIASMYFHVCDGNAMIEAWSIHGCKHCSDVVHCEKFEAALDKLDLGVQ